jgi:transcriptional regulator with XRE-family HTH domain
LIAGSQVRAARAILRLTVTQLAETAQVAPNTVVRIEADKGVNMASMRAIQRALEAAGVEFIAENGGGPGVRLRERGNRSV